MRRRGLRRTWLIVGICTGVYILLGLTGLLNKQKIWPNVPVDYQNEKHVFSLSEGDEYGFITNGPYIELPAGTYRLKWQIEGDGENIIRLMDSNEAEIDPAEFRTVPGDFEGEAYFELKDAVHNFRINTEFCDGTWIAVHNFRLYSPVYRDHYITLAALFLFVVLLSYFHECGKLAVSSREILVALIIAVCFASIPAFREDVIAAHDVDFHAVRLHNLLDSLKAGQFPGRVGGYSYNGYGAVTSVFYPDLLLYPFVLLLYLGASMTYVLNMLILTMNALTAICMYIAAKRIFSDRKAGVYSAILYVCCGFRLDRLYVSYMVGQMFAMAFLPLFFLGLWEVFFGDESRWPTLVIGATLVFQCHMLTTLLCAGVAAVAVICFGYKLWRERRIRALLMAMLSTVLLNLTTLVPLMTTYLSGVTTSVGTYGFVDLTHEMVQMFGTDKELGLAMILGVAALFCTNGSALSKEKWRDVAVLILGAVCLWMCTDLFPWRPIFAFTNGIFEILQFSWRFLAVGSVCFALCGGLGYACLFKAGGAKEIFAVLAVAILSATPIINMALDMDVKEFGTDASPYMLTPEYQFEGTDLIATHSRSILSDGDVEITQYIKDGTRIDAYIEARGDSSITFPIFGFEGYAVELNDQAVEWTRGENNRLAVFVPAGTQGKLSIKYAGCMIWRISDVISLVFLIVGSIFYFSKRRKVRL